MERLSENKPTGMNGNALRTWGLLFLAAGVIGRGLLQTHILGISTMSAQELLSAMGESQMTMILATFSLVLQALETCAAPIFGLMLVTGVEKTRDIHAYLLRVAGLAVLSEIPYNLALKGSVLDLSTRNPVFAVLLCLILLYFYRRYAGKTFQNVLIRVVVTVAAVLWGQMLRIDAGSCMVILVAVLWAFRKKPLYRNFAGAAAAVVCTMISPFYLAAPMGFLAVHFYNGEESTNSRLVNYLAYPAILLVTAAMGFLL